MSRRVSFGPEASAELEDAARWYEQRHAGLGLAFLAAVDAAVSSILRWPQAGARIDGMPKDLELRRVPVARFPYHLVYLAAESQTQVLAVAHDRRRPRYWSDRLAT